MLGSWFHHSQFACSGADELFARVGVFQAGEFALAGWTFEVDMPYCPFSLSSSTLAGGLAYQFEFCWFVHCSTYDDAR